MTDLDRDLETANINLLHTERGVYVSVEKLRELEQKRLKEREEEEAAPRPKTWAAAKKAARKDPELSAAFADRPPRIAPVGR